MKLFECQHCGQLLYFENTRCERCGHVLGYLPDAAVLSALTEEGGDRWRPLAVPERLFRFCANAAYDACNWLVPAERADAFCRACRLNRTIPDLSPPEHLLRWQRLEAAKHRLVYGLLRLGLPLVSKFENPDAGLAFDFLADSGTTFPETPRVMTGHTGGLINPMKDDPQHQFEAHHFCQQVNEDFAQCALYDGNTADANLNGIEYIISERLFESLPADEGSTGARTTVRSCPASWWRRACPRLLIRS